MHILDKWNKTHDAKGLAECFYVKYHYRISSGEKNEGNRFG